MNFKLLDLLNYLKRVTMNIPLRIGALIRRVIRAPVQQVSAAFLVRVADKAPIRKILTENLAFRERVLSCLDEMTAKNSLELYGYEPNLDVLVWKPSLKHIFRNLTGELFSPGNIASDSDYWMRAVDNLDIKLDIVFDVGVNSGHTSVWFAQRATSVYGFEPNQDNIARIEQLMKIRNINNIEVVTSAVSNQVGFSTFYLKNWHGSHSLADVGPKTIGTVEVPTTTIDRFCSDHGIQRISILKIDVEGFELEVLQGAESLLKNKMIDLVLFEYCPIFYKQRDIDSRDPLFFLLDMGYKLMEVKGNPVDMEAIAGYEETDLLAIPSDSPTLSLIQQNLVNSFT